jgi:glutamine cyclotransferase
MSGRFTLRQIEAKFRELDSKEGRVNQYYEASKLQKAQPNRKSRSNFKVVGGIKTYQEPE